MTNEEAIAVLHCINDMGGWSTETYIAFDLAIKALEERPQGEWKLDGGGVYCSECKMHPDYISGFCPNCGAKMKM